MVSLFIKYPEWIKPEVFYGIKFPSFLSFLSVIRWYGVMYIVALLIFLVLARYLIAENRKNGELKTFDEKRLDEIFFWGVIGLILGGRVFYCLVYDFPYFSKHPLEIILPINSSGQFVGFSGMSYHGAVIGIFVACALYATINRLDWREVTDIMFLAPPLGYSFGRLGNFINAELYGRITSSPIGMLFPNADKLPVTLPDVQKVINELGWTINEQLMTVTTKTGEVLHNLLDFGIINNSAQLMINLPRHPSQLYEMFLEGILLFLIMWFVFKRFKKELKLFDGAFGPIYLIGYGIARIVVEFFRQPDPQFADISSGKWIGTVVGFLSMGQILSIIMILAGIFYGIFLVYIYKPQNLNYVTDNKKNSKKA